MMQRIRYLLMKYTPEFILVKLRNRVRTGRKKKLAEQERKGEGLDFNSFLLQLKQAGINHGDVLLVHSSLSRIGFIEGGAKTVADALKAAVSREGTLLMPAFSAEGRNLDYIKSLDCFDVNNTASKMGAVTEYFRKLPGTFRSLHPTDSICASGKNAAWFVEGHEKLQRPYAAGSPFRKLCDRNGKILMLGTTLNGACTNLHTLEDYFDKFLYPVYMPDLYNVNVRDKNGTEMQMQTFVHNPEWSVKRNADALKPMFIEKGVLKEIIIGKAPSLLIDANRMLNVMVDAYMQNGVTMYTPYGGPLPEKA